MPHNAGYHKTKTEDNGSPKHRTPLHNIPSLIAKSPEGNIEVHAIPHEKGSHECTDDLLLYGKVHGEMVAGGSQYKEINDTHERANVS